MRPIVVKAQLEGAVQRYASRGTLPNTSSGRPINAIILLWSDVFRELGRDRVGARLARGGEPQSSRVCNNPSKKMRKPRIDKVESPYQVKEISKSIGTCIAAPQGDRRT